MPINQFDVKNIQMFLNNRKKALAKYLRDMKTLLGQIFECAKRDGYPKDNPAKDPHIVIPYTKKFEQTALTIEHFNSIIHALDFLQGDEQVYWALVVYTGMRRGEILGLRWEDIDIGNNMIHVVRNVTRTNNQPIIGTPKTASGERNIPIIADLLKYLLPLKQEGYILDNDGKPKTLTMFKNMFNLIKEVTDLCGATSHSFRHTMGILLNDAGADVKTIQGILGQKDYKTTMDRYVHPVETRKHEAISKISNLLSTGNRK